MESENVSRNIGGWQCQMTQRAINMKNQSLRTGNYGVVDLIHFQQMWKLGWGRKESDYIRILVGGS